MSTTRPRSRIRTASAIAAVGAALLSPLLVAACGGDDESGASKETTSSTSSKPSEKLHVTGVWARAAKAGANSAVYMTIEGGAADDALVGAGVAADLADKVELHETVTAAPTTMPPITTPSSTMAGSATTMTPTTMTPTTMTPTTVDAGAGAIPSTGGMMSMQPVERIPVPAGGSVKLEPGGLHVMLFGLSHDLAVGSEVPVTLTFEKAGRIQVTAEVREL